MAAARKAAAASKRTTTRKTAAKTATPRKRAPAKKAATKAPSTDARPPGRPPLLEIKPELQQKIVTFVRSGAFPERAAIAVGISERTHYAWMARGRAELDRRETEGEHDQTEQMYVTYLEAIERAVAEAEMLLMGNALKGGATGGAAMNILERRFRDRWGAKAPPAPPPAPAQPTTGPVTGLGLLEQKRAEREQAAR